MTRFVQQSEITTQATIILKEPELRALVAIACYGDKVFLEAFYKNIGRAYLAPHEAGLRSLFASIRDDIPPILSRVDAARRASNER